MQKFRFKKILQLFIFLSLFFGLRTCYYGSPIRSCIYTEEKVPLPPVVKTSQIFLIKPVVVVNDGSPEYSCLTEMRTISNKLVEQKYAYIYKNMEQRTITPSDGMTFEAVQLIAVTKHGITTIDSGSGPIYYLILKDQSGTYYQVATVGLGINSGDEFLKAVSEDKEFILNYDLFK